jgi:2'-5' RNA ligase
LENQKNLKGYIYFPLPTHLHSLFPKEGRLAGGDESVPHITILYLPDLDEDEIEKVHLACEEFSKTLKPFTAIFGKTKSFPATDEGLIPWYASIESDRIGQARDWLMICLANQGLNPPVKFKDFIAHATLTYLESGESCDIQLPQEEFSLDKIEFNFSPKEESE